MITTHKEPYDFLSQHKLAVLSTAADKNDVWGAAIYYAVDEAHTTVQASDPGEAVCYSSQSLNQTATSSATTSGALSR